MTKIDIRKIKSYQKIVFFIAAIISSCCITINASAINKIPAPELKQAYFNSHLSYKKHYLLPQYYYTPQLRRADKRNIPLNKIPSAKDFKYLAGLNRNTLAKAIHGYRYAVLKGMVHTPFLVIVNYRITSDKPRLWIFNLRTRSLIAKLRVAHGSNSGTFNATKFSNKINSHKSCLGVFVTDKTYFGKYGYSLHLRGLQPGINDNTYRRHIVVHPGYYVGDKAVLQHHEAGKTWGCLAMDPKYVTKVINLIKNGSVIDSFA